MTAKGQRNSRDTDAWLLRQYGITDELSIHNSHICLRCGERQLNELFRQRRRGECAVDVCLRCQTDASAEGVERRRIVAAFETARNAQERAYEIETGATL